MKFLFFALAVGLTVSAPAYSKPKNSTSPAAMAGSLCASSGVAKTIRGVLLRLSPSDPHPENSPDQIPKLEAIFTIDNSAVEGIDIQIEKVSCSGTAHVKFKPEPFLSEDKLGFSIPLLYSIQPEADGNGLLVKVSNGQRISEDIDHYIEASMYQRKAAGGNP